MHGKMKFYLMTNFIPYFQDSESMFLNIEKIRKYISSMLSSKAWNCKIQNVGSGQPKYED